MSTRILSVPVACALWAGASFALWFAPACSTAELPTVGGGGATTPSLEDAARAALDDAGGAARFTLPDDGDLEAIPQDPRNPLTPAKVRLGRLLFHDPVFQANPKEQRGNKTASCAACHHASAGFQAGVRQGIGEGGQGFGTAGEARAIRADYVLADVDVQPVRSPSVLHVAWQPNLLWNGQFGATAANVGTEDKWSAGTPKAKNHLGYEGAETQAIAGQDVHRLTCDHRSLAAIERYRVLFERAFPGGAAPAGVDDGPINQENAGLAMAAYERTLLANHAPFQRFLRGEHDVLTDAELRGATLFFGRARCVACHDGPALDTPAFYALGLGDLEGTDVAGYDPSKPEHRGRGGFTGNAAEDFQFKVPQLYNLRDVVFFGHGGTLHSIRDVVAYKNRARAENPAVPATQLAVQFVPLGLSDDDVDDLTAFLSDALYDPDLARYEPSPDELPSGLCVPVDDPVARAQLGCE
jgi:cytochrome c peroxidase